MQYEKPVAIPVDSVAEGIYMGSGATENDSNVCGSIYMKGIWVMGTYQPIKDGYKVGRGCEGCPANWGDKCHVKEVNYKGDFRPSWEVQGHLPDELGY